MRIYKRMTVHNYTCYNYNQARNQRIQHVSETALNKKITFAQHHILLKGRKMRLVCKNKLGLR